MRSLLRTFFLVVILYGVVCTGTVVYAETIESFDARIAVHENGTIEVTEQIVYNFGTKERHGIFRNIPYSYQAKTETYTADVRSVLVTDEAGKPLPFGESRGNGELSIKIGDPNVTTTGLKTYVISYIVDGPFLYFEDFDEFYWNVTGFWEFPITRASVLVDLPSGAQVRSVACYKGEDGSKTPCDKDERLMNEERAGYNAIAENLSIQQGLTVAVAFPKGVIQERQNPWEEETVPWWYVFWPGVIPIITFFFMVRLWRTRGRDPKGVSSIVTQFSPPKGLSPALSGVVLHERVEGREMSAEMVRLAVEGYIKIHRFETKVLLFSVTDYLLERTGTTVPKDNVGALLLEKLFEEESFKGSAEVQGEVKEGVLVSKMKHAFLEQKKVIDAEVYQEVFERGYFLRRPDTVRMRYGFVAVPIALLGVFSFFVLSGFVWVVTFGVSLLLSGFIVGGIGYFMPVKTAEGVRMKEYLLGFKRYLEVAEKDRIDFHSAPDQSSNEPEKTLHLFDTCLPYAMVFGVEEKWAEKFEGAFTEEPQWYSGGGHAFSAGVFASDLSNFSTTVSQATAPQSSGSSGGGSSGGGFGGGGGGSW